MLGAFELCPLERAAEGVERLLRKSIHEAQLVGYALLVELIDPSFDAASIVGPLNEALLIPVDRLDSELEHNLCRA